MAGGVAVATYAPDLGVTWGSGAVALALVLIGLGTALAGYRRWRGNEDAIRADRALPEGRCPRSLAAAVAFVVVVVGVLVGHRGAVPVTTPPPGTRTRPGLAAHRARADRGRRPDRRPGLQAPRTAPLLVIAGAAGLLGAAVLGVLAPLRRRLLRRRMAADDDVAAPGAVAFITLAVVLLAVLAGVAVIAVP